MKQVMKSKRASFELEIKDPELSKEAEEEFENGKGENKADGGEDK